MKIGILGGGQLAYMLSMAASPLGLSTLCYEPAVPACAARVTDVITASYTDVEALRAFAQQVDVITFETENITSEIFSILAEEQHKFAPHQNALLIAQDRLLEKNCLNQLGIATAPYEAVDSLASLTEAAQKLGYPCVLKTRRGGYDGKGQFVLRSDEDLSEAFASLGSQPLLLEGFVPFSMEVSMLAVRDQAGIVKTYPLVANTHQQGILRESSAPFEHPALYQQAAHAAQTLLDHLQYVGVIAIEFFVVNDQLVANEIAPRVHNTGHWTIEGTVTSQFENHIRAIAGLPLGDCSPRGYSHLLNIIGEEPELKSLLNIAGLHYHTYGKAPRPQRKLGHVTLCHDDPLQLEKMRRQAQALIL